MLDLLMALAAWYLCGVVGFLYWWAEDFKVDARALADALAFGVMGPVTVIGGWLIHRVMVAPDESQLKPIPIRIDDRRRRRR